ncbi:hypothetical protein CRUP_038499 [Coryphaenoides rupestris]|nr:hypothetical protein CRUP_038499 [Coryphaenoides rupestris]
MMKFAWDNYKRYAWGKNELRPLTKNGHMMKFAWDNYKRYAWGKNELRPLTKNGHVGNMFGCGRGETSGMGLEEGVTRAGRVLHAAKAAISIPVRAFRPGEIKGTREATRVARLGECSAPQHTSRREMEEGVEA